MPLPDFIGSQRTVVLDGGRRYVCRPPTVHTVMLALTYFEAEFRAVHAAAHAGETPLELGLEEIVRVCAGTRLARVLDTCVEIWGGAPGELPELVARDVELQVRLALAVLDLCDPAWIYRNLGIDLSAAPGEAGEISDEPSAMDGAICAIAAAFGRPPAEIPRWPYAAFARAVQLGYGAHGEAPAAAPADTRGDAPPEALEALGIHVHRPKGA